MQWHWQCTPSTSHGSDAAHSFTAAAPQCHIAPPPTIPATGRQALHPHAPRGLQGSAFPEVMGISCQLTIQRGHHCHPSSAAGRCSPHHTHVGPCQPSRATHLLHGAPCPLEGAKLACRNAPPPHHGWPPAQQLSKPHGLAILQSGFAFRTTAPPQGAEADIMQSWHQGCHAHAISMPLPHPCPSTSQPTLQPQPKAICLPIRPRPTRTHRGSHVHHPCRPLPCIPLACGLITPLPWALVRGSQRITSGMEALHGHISKCIAQWQCHFHGVAVGFSKTACPVQKSMGKNLNLSTCQHATWRLLQVDDARAASENIPNRLGKVVGTTVPCTHAPRIFQVASKQEKDHPVSNGQVEEGVVAPMQPWARGVGCEGRGRGRGADMWGHRHYPP